MKLRNKKNGMIGEVGYISTSDGKIIVNNIDNQDEWYDYNSLAELSGEWEDYEEPKEYWYLDYDGDVLEFKELGCKWQDRMKQVGNYFKTEEEAEKAVEKLKAWQRLKDKGFRFEWWSSEPEGYSIHFYINPMDWDKETTSDLGLLFGVKMSRIIKFNDGD